MFSLPSIQSNNFQTQSTSQLFDHHHHQHHRYSTVSARPLPRFAVPRSRHGHLCLSVRAQKYDCEDSMSHSISSSGKLKIAIVGFGNFGQFIAKALVRQGHTVLAHSRTDYSHIARSLNVYFFRDLHDLCEQHPDVVLLCTSINSIERVIRSLPLQQFKRNTLFVDVLSVKEFPKNIFLQLLPSHFDILCTHPMFGPTSGKESWKGLPFMFDKVRIGEEESRTSRVEKFIDIFEKEGCRMIEMSCAEHDRHAAGSQFITHTIGRVLEKLEPESTPINTKGYEKLLNLMDNTTADSFDLYYGLFMYNNNSMEFLERLDMALDSVKKELFGQVLSKLEKRVQKGSMVSQFHETRLALPPPSNNFIEKLKVEMKGEALS